MASHDGATYRNEAARCCPSDAEGARVHYWFLWGFVGLVSLYDAWMVFVCRDVIHATERNPIGRALIELDSGGLTYFLTAKLIGTVIVMCSLIHVHRVLQPYRDWIIGGVASFQAWLLFYLSL